MVIKVIIAVLGAFILWWFTARMIKRLVPFPAPWFYGPLFDSKLRRIFQPADKVIQRSGMRKGMQVLEVGCGSGAFTTFAARAVGKKGKVHALDIQPKMLRQLENKLNRPENRDIENIKLVESDACHLSFADNFFDLVFLVGALQEIHDRKKALREVKRVLKPGGVLAVTEMFPDPDYPFKATTIKMGKEAGFVVDKVLGGFLNYTVRFIKPSN